MSLAIHLKHIDGEVSPLSNADKEESAYSLQIQLLHSKGESFESSDATVSENKLQFDFKNTLKAELDSEIKKAFQGTCFD